MISSDLRRVAGVLESSMSIGRRGCIWLDAENSEYICLLIRHIADEVGKLEFPEENKIVALPAKTTLAGLAGNDNLHQPPDNIA